MDDLQCSKRARPRADPAADALPLKAEVGVDQLERVLGTDCNAGAAISTLVSVYPEHCTHNVVVVAKTFMLLVRVAAPDSPLLTPNLWPAVPGRPDPVGKAVTTLFYRS